MPKVKSGGYIFQKHLTDHPPPHVHIYKDSKQIAKWDIQNWKPMSGEINRKIEELLKQLINEGKL